MYILVPYGNDNPAKVAVLRAITLPLCLGWILQCVWQFVFTAYDFAAASVVIWAAFVCMMWALFEIYALYQDSSIEMSWLDRTIYFGVAVNAGWLSVASCLGLFIHAISEGAVDSDLQPFVVVVPFAITFLAVYLSMTQMEVAYPLTVTWAITAVRDNVEANNVQQVGKVVQGLTIFVAFVQILRLAMVYSKKRLSKAQPEDRSGPLLGGQF